jgi:hypothetical protein
MTTMARMVPTGRQTEAAAVVPAVGEILPPVPASLPRTLVCSPRLEMAIAGWEPSGGPRAAGAAGDTDFAD